MYLFNLIKVNDLWVIDLFGLVNEIELSVKRRNKLDK